MAQAEQKNILTDEEIANCDGIIVAADKSVETARFDGKPVLFHKSGRRNTQA